MSRGTVFIVDDDPSVRDATALFLGLNGLPTQLFASAESFLTAYRREWTGCMLLDLKMPGMGGLELQQAMIARGSPLRIIVATAHGDVATARAALKAGAVDFLEKPVDNAVLLDVVRHALGSESGAATTRDDWSQRVARLTERERQVMELVTAGRHNREIGMILGISPRTVEVYKSRMMEKLRVETLAELIRNVIEGRTGPQA